MSISGAVIAPSLDLLHSSTVRARASGSRTLSEPNRGSQGSRMVPQIPHLMSMLCFRRSLLTFLAASQDSLEALGIYPSVRSKFSSWCRESIGLRGPRTVSDLPPGSRYLQRATVTLVVGELFISCTLILRPNTTDHTLIMQSTIVKGSIFIPALLSCWTTT